MTHKLWFQSGVGILLVILIIKFFVEINWIFNPIFIIFKTILIPLLLGGVLYYISEPLQRLLESKGLPRWASMVTIILVLVGLITGFLLLIIPPIVEQVNSLVRNSPMIAAKLQEAIDYFLQNKSNLPDQLEETIDSITNSIQDIAMTGSKYIYSFLTGAVTTTFTLILVPFFFIFMLKDHERFAPNIYSIFKSKRRTWVKNTLADIDTVLRSYVQGQVLISLILATMMFIGYLIIKLDYALLLALFAFFMNMIPFIGPWISLLPAIIVAAIQDPILIIWVCVVTLVAQQIESNLVTPNIMGKSLDIHPLTVISLVLAAGNIAGFIGILVAIPTYAVIKVIIRNIYKEREQIAEAVTQDVD